MQSGTALQATRLALTMIPAAMAGVGGMSADAIAMTGSCDPFWDHAVGVPGANDLITSMAVFDGPPGPTLGGANQALYIGGRFTSVGGITANHIAMWIAGEWHAAGTGINGEVRALEVFDDGSGPALYAAGEFTVAGNTQANNIARWNGFQWAAVGTGVNQRVFDLTVFDDGSGPALYVGGEFTTAGGLPASRIARWDGEQWSDVGGGVSATSSIVSVTAMTVHDDGTGPALYATGDFTEAGGVEAFRIARWDGRAWSGLGEGLCSSARALAVFDDGSGPTLYAGGFFNIAGGVTVNGMARWNGSSWSGVGGGGNSGVQDLYVFDDGSGPALYAGGQFSVMGGVTASRIARWDGSEWSSLGLGIPNGQVWALHQFDDDSGNRRLYAGGNFAFPGNVNATRIVAWNVPQSAAPGDLNCDSVVDATDLLILLNEWGTCADPDDCPADLNGDGFVDGADLLILLGNWG